MSAAAPYRAQLDAAKRDAVAQLETSHARMLATIAPTLAALYRDMRAAQQNGTPLPPSWIHEQQRLARIQHLVSQQVEHYATIAQMTTDHAQQQAQALGVEAARAQLQEAAPLGDDGTFKRVAAAVLAALIGGDTRVSLFALYGFAAWKAVTSALLLGLSPGMTLEAIDQAVHTALDAPRWQSITAALTALYSAYNSATLETYRANSDIVTGWTWICHFANSCGACIAMHGSQHGLDETLDDHPHGGCEMEPITASASAVPPGADWFDAQPASEQESILGPGKFALYQSGQITLPDLVGVRSDGRIYEKPLKAL